MESRSELYRSLGEDSERRELGQEGVSVFGHLEECVVCKEEAARQQAARFDNQRQLRLAPARRTRAYAVAFI